MQSPQESQLIRFWVHPPFLRLMPGNFYTNALALLTYVLDSVEAGSGT